VETAVVVLSIALLVSASINLLFCSSLALLWWRTFKSEARVEALDDTLAEHLKVVYEDPVMEKSK
jgi:hypothetical protein